MLRQSYLIIYDIKWMPRQVIGVSHMLGKMPNLIRLMKTNIFFRTFKMQTVYSGLRDQIKVKSICIPQPFACGWTSKQRWNQGHPITNCGYTNHFLTTWQAVRHTHQQGLQPNCKLKQTFAKNDKCRCWLLTNCDEKHNNIKAEQSEAFSKRTTNHNRTNSRSKINCNGTSPASTR